SILDGHAPPDVDRLACFRAMRACYPTTRSNPKRNHRFDEFAVVGGSSDGNCLGRFTDLAGIGALPSVRVGIFLDWAALLGLRKPMSTLQAARVRATW